MLSISPGLMDRRIDAAAALPFCRGEEEDLPVDLCSFSRLMPQTLGQRIKSRNELWRRAPWEMVESLLVHIYTSQLVWLGHLFRIPPGDVCRTCPMGRIPRGRPRTRWRDYVSRLVREHPGIPPEELEEVSAERDVWASLLRLLSLSSMGHSEYTHTNPPC